MFSFWPLTAWKQNENKCGTFNAQLTRGAVIARALGAWNKERDYG